MADTSDLAPRLTGRVLQLRDGPAAAALRRGGHPSTEIYAYAHLADLWDDAGWARRPVLRFAGLAATCREVADRPEVTFGGHLAKLTHGADGMAESSIERRLLVAHASDLDGFHQLLRGLLASPQAERVGIGWRDVAATYLGWEHPDRQRRERIRTRPLEQFYQQLARQQAAAAATTDTIKE